MASPSPLRLTPVQWTVCVIAAIGFAFDIYELLMLPLIAPRAIPELVPGAAIGSDQFSNWVAVLFWVPALAGGLFGLLGGYLTDRLGRRFVLTWSILLYAFSAFFAGFSTNIYMLLVLRCTTFIGVCVEFVAAVAWLAELFPDPKQREKVIGYTQAFSSAGGLLVAVANGFLVQYAAAFPAIAIPGFLTGLVGEVTGDPHAAWRYTLMSGLIPAIPLILIRPFLPESPVWAKRRQEGTLRRPTIAALFAPELRRTSIVTTIGFACTLGVAFGAIQMMPQIVPGLADVKAGAAAATEKALAAERQKRDLSPESVAEITKRAQGAYSQKIAAEYTKVQELGGLTGRFLLALLVAGALSWGWLIRAFQIPGLILTPLLFYFFLTVENRHFFSINLESVYLGTLPITTTSLGMFLVGLCTVAQLSFWGNYLPHVFPVHLRGTGESLAANIGGRMIGTSAAAATALLAKWLPYEQGPMKVAVAAAIVGGTACLIGLITSFFLPEPAKHHAAEHAPESPSDNAPQLAPQHDEA